LSHEPTIAAESLDAVVEVIGDIERPVSGDGHASRSQELTVAAATTSHAGQL
jgi:hypothetical protein